MIPGFVFVIFAFVVGLTLGRISTAPKSTPTFPLSNKAIALIAYEASRAYRHSKGDFSVKTFNNLPTTLRTSLVDRIAAYRARPHLPDDAGFEHRLQAAIVALAR